jgi:hypothetical protein
MLTRDGRGAHRVVMRSECVRGLPESAGIHSRWPTGLGPDRQAQVEPTPKRTNPEEILAFGVADATRERLSLGLDRRYCRPYT